MNDTVLWLLWIAMMYTWIHFVYLSFVRSWKERSWYEMTVSIFAIVTFILFIIWSL